jgi:hypothetical protein
MMNINEFVKDYCDMILYPIKENKNYGFKLTSGARIFFEDTRMAKSEVARLRRHYNRRGLTWDSTYME